MSNNQKVIHNFDYDYDLQDLYDYINNLKN